MQKQLRFNSLNVRRIQEQFEQMPEQGFFCRMAGRGFNSRISGRAGQGKNVANDRLVLFVDAENIAGDAPRLKRSEARQHVIIEILHQQPRRGIEIPVQPLLPEFTLCFQHWAQRRSREVPQIENFRCRAQFFYAPLS